MPFPTLVAMLEARPDRPFWGRNWVESTFRAHLPGFAQQGRVDGWSVGGCISAETLVQSRPMARPTDDLVSDLLRSGAPCSLGRIHSTDDDAPEATVPPRTARFRRWMSAFIGPSLTEDSRARILGSLPAFLSRDAVRAPDTQLHLLALLDQLYSATGYQDAFADPQSLADALHGFATTLGNEAPTAMFVSDGRTLAILHTQGCLLCAHPPADQRPAAGLISTGRDHLPASLWIWKRQEPVSVPRDAERLSAGIFTAQAQEPGSVVRH